MSTAQFAVVAAALTDQPRLAARMAREIGFRGVLLDAWSAGLTIPELSASGRRELIHLLSSQDQHLVGLRSDLNGQGLTAGNDVERALWRLERAMEAAAGLRAPLLCVDLGTLPEEEEEARAKPQRQITAEQAGLIIIPTLSPAAAPEPAGRRRPEAKRSAAFVAQVDEAMRELGRRADRYGVMLALRSELASFAALHRAIRRADCPWFGLDLDPVAVLRDDWSMDQVLARFAPLLRHVVARDALLGAERRTQPAVVGQGKVDWNQLLAGLDDAGYAGWITVDATGLTQRAGAAASGLRYLRRMDQETGLI